MSIKIETEIVKVELNKVDEDLPLNEKKDLLLKRPYLLKGTTYKLKPSNGADALYITINDMIRESKTYPFEIFINTKNAEHYQWTTALTRVVSAIFRKSTDLYFLAEELKSVIDPNGGYFDKGTYVPSIVAGIGRVIEEHFNYLNMADKPLEVKETEYVEILKNQTRKIQCKKCLQFTVIKQEGCMTCISCGDSKCS